MKIQLVREKLLGLLTVTFEKLLLREFLLKWIHFALTNNTAGWSWRLGWDGECNISKMCKNNLISLQVICFMTWPLHHHATVVILHIRYTWKYLLLTVLNIDLHFFVYVWHGQGKWHVWGKRKMHAGFQQGSLNKRNYLKTYA